MDPRGQCEGEGEVLWGVRPAAGALTCCVMLGNLLCFPEMISNMRCDVRIHKIKIHKKPSTEQVIDDVGSLFHVQDEVTFIFSLCKFSLQNKA